MTGVEFVDWIIGSVVALAGVFGVLAGGMKMWAEGRILKQAPKTASQIVFDRLDKLEKAAEEDSKDRFRMRGQIYRMAGVVLRETNTVVQWYESGRKPPPPDQEIRVIKDLIQELKEDQEEASHTL